MVSQYVRWIGILIFFTNCGADSNCCQKVSLYYLDAAADLIGKAKSNFPSEGTCEKSGNAMDCSELLENGYKENGVYTIWPQSRIIDDKPLEVYCDMETDGGGWTLIQRRGRFGEPSEVVQNFNKGFNSYKEGFGDLQKEFWLGNDNIFALTNRRLYSARFDLRTKRNVTSYAHYDTFWIDDESNKYTLHIADYKGDAGDGMTRLQNQKFSAKDEDNDNHADKHCGRTRSAGWWYNSCRDVNLNGIPFGQILWASREESISLEATEIKIRPRNFKPPHASLDNTPM